MKYLFSLLFLIFSFVSFAQNGNGYFKKFELKVDTSTYAFPQDAVLQKGEKILYFNVDSNEEIVELTLYPSDEYPIKSAYLYASDDFEILDSLRKISNRFFRGKVRLLNLYESKFLRFAVNLDLENGKNVTEELRINPSYPPSVKVPFDVLELYMGEERTIELPAVNAFNIQKVDTWTSMAGIRFRVQTTDQAVRVLVQPEQMGSRELNLNLTSARTFIIGKGKVSNEIPPIKLKFSIRPGRLHFINFDKTDFFLDPGEMQATEVQFDYHPGFEMNKTYRIENQQRPGGRLIAELFTVSVVGNNKILGWIRSYSLHKISEGYLFVKDGDAARFITNFNILPKPSIEQISVLREGQDWTTNNVVYPGERIELRIDGKGLSKAEFQFEGIKDLQLDTGRTSENVQFYFIRVPLDISKKRIHIYMNRVITRYDLQMREYQTPRELDFIAVYFDKEARYISSDYFNKPVLYRHSIPDINLIFYENQIDNKARLYGKQHLVIEVKMFNQRNEMIQFQRIDNVTICPGETSPRYSFYDLKDCRRSNINLNEYLLQKTFDMEGWSRLEILIKHNELKYGSTPGYSRKLTFIKERRVLFDLQISFPAGLLVKRFDQPGVGNLTGISTAFLAQLSFYDKERAGRLKPYKIGAGFIALDVFNVNARQRDLGIIVMGSLLPLRKDTRFTFPLYLGGGYLLQNDRFFLVFGPGIQFNF
ncbi:MAG: hypothetical protein ACK40G_12140 [Cytophagaceae bacterium]